MNITLSLTFISITLLSLMLFYLGTGKDKRVLLVSSLWIMMIGVLSYTGYFTKILVTPPRFLLVLLGAVTLSFFLYKTVVANKLNTTLLFSIHILRLPIEWVLYRLFLLKKVPVLMTFLGYNFDIVMGISAIVLVAYLLFTKNKLSPTFMFFWSIAGLTFLTIVVTIAIFSSPLPLQLLAFDQPNTAVLLFPFTYLPAFVVPVVLVSHILILKLSRSTNIGHTSLE